MYSVVQRSVIRSYTVYEKVDGSIFLWSVDWDRQEAVGCCYNCKRQRNGHTVLCFERRLAVLVEYVCTGFIDY